MMSADEDVCDIYDDIPELQSDENECNPNEDENEFAVFELPPPPKPSVSPPVMIRCLSNSQQTSSPTKSVDSITSEDENHPKRSRKSIRTETTLEVLSDDLTVPDISNLNSKDK